MRVPEWLKEPEVIWIKCTIIGQDSESGELVVRIKVNGDEFTAFVSANFVDQQKSLLQGYHIANWGNDLLVDIPGESFTSGSRIRVPEAEKTSVIVPAA